MKYFFFGTPEDRVLIYIFKLELRTVVYCLIYIDAPTKVVERFNAQSIKIIQYII